MKQERITQLKWKFPEFPPRPTKREVVFSLMDFKGALYFVNDSGETLKIVSSDSFGFVSDGVVEKNPKFIYNDVKPGESVKVEEYDEYYDLDYVLGFKIFIESNNLGQISIFPPMKKGGVIAQPLMFKDGVAPKHVSIKKYQILRQMVKIECNIKFVLIFNNLTFWLT